MGHECNCGGSTFTAGDRQKLDQMYAVIMGLAEAMGELSNNPVAGSMLKNFGIALPKI